VLARNPNRKKNRHDKAKYLSNFTPGVSTPAEGASETIVEMQRELSNRMAQAVSEFKGNLQAFQASAQEEKRSDQPRELSRPILEQPGCEQEEFPKDILHNRARFIRDGNKTKYAEYDSEETSSLKREVELVASAPDTQHVPSFSSQPHQLRSETTIPLPDFGKKHSSYTFSSVLHTGADTLQPVQEESEQISQTNSAVLEPGPYRAAAERAIKLHRLYASGQ
jgi:hypothetical protein